MLNNKTQNAPSIANTKSCLCVFAIEIEVKLQQNRSQTLKSESDSSLIGYLRRRKESF